jgi:hypothetical protein
MHDSSPLSFGDDGPVRLPGRDRRRPGSELCAWLVLERKALLARWEGLCSEMEAIDRRLEELDAMIVRG